MGLVEQYHTFLRDLRSLKIINDKPHNRTIQLLLKHPLLMERLNTLTSFLEVELTVIQKIHTIINNVFEQPKCLFCKKAVGMYKGTQKIGMFKEYCNEKCSNRCPLRATKTKHTMIERYGVEHALQSLTFRMKFEDTLNKNYGVTVPGKSLVITQKIKNTNYKLYGVDYPLQSQEIYLKSYESNKDNHNGKHSFLDLAVQTRSVSTLRENFGVNHPSHINKDPAFVTNLTNKEWLEHQHHTLEKSLSQIAVETHNTTATVARKCKEKKVDIKLFSSSFGEKQVVDFIRTLLPHATITIRDKAVLHPKELDIYLPDYNLAIEYNGTYRHSEACGKGREYHVDKTQRCADKNIELMHIWEHDWDDLQKRIEIKQYIKEYLGLEKETVPHFRNVDGLVYIHDRQLPHKQFLKRDYILVRTIPPKKNTLNTHTFWDCGKEVWVKCFIQ